MKPELLIRKAILAPSGHNAQAWKFSVTDNNDIIISPDFSRSLPVIDPKNRELYISLGCAVENISIFAESIGFTSVINEFNGNVTISFTETHSVKNTSLAKAIDSRQTNRSVYSGKIIPDEQILQLKQGNLCIYKHDSAEFKQLCKLVDIANTAQMNNPNFKQELKQWLRYNEHEAKQSGDGLSYDTLGTLNIPSFLRKLVVPLGLNADSQNKSDLKKLLSSSHFAVFTANDTISEWINTGRTLERVLLTAETLGIACAYMNQPCEEDSIREILKISLNLNEQPQIIVRFGYADRTPRSHRRPISSFLINKNS